VEHKSSDLAGREGELIFRLVYNQAKCNKPIERLWISSLEDNAIRKGFENLKPGKEYDNLYKSALCRERADWLIGMNATRYFTVNNGNKGVLSIGRVQTPTLAMIVNRDFEIANFVKSKYYTVEINCGAFTATSDKITNLEQAQALTKSCQIAKAFVADIKKENKSVNPPKLYDLTSLQRDANKIYGFTAQQTLNTLQKLYEAKLVTYPRTDSRYLTDDMESTVAEVIKAVTNITDFAKGIVDNPNIKPTLDSTKVSDHHAIIPTANIQSATFTALSTDEIKIMYMVIARLLSATAPKYRYESTTITLNCNNNIFTATGKTITDKGFKAVDEQLAIFAKCKIDDTNTPTLPKITINQEYAVTSKLLEHYTQPPKPYTEDTLLSAMERAGNEDYTTDDVERKGLGTPATRANIIETLVFREYIERKGKNLISTDKGKSLINIVPDILKSAKMTAMAKQ
jgi:DNA topoisomerase-3